MRIARFVAWVVLVLGASLAHAQGTQLLVSNVQVAQRPFTALFDITYDLQTVGGMPVTIGLRLSTDGGLTFPNACTAVSGNVGVGVLPGTMRHITWNAGAEYPGFSSPNCRLRVVADDGAAAYRIEEMAGAWEFHGVALDGPGAPWWTWSVDTMAPDGTYTGYATDSGANGQTYPESATIALSAGGLVTLPGTDDFFIGAVDATKGIMVATDVWAGGPDAGTVELAVGVRTANAYSSSDLVGRWENNRIASVPGAPWWLRGALTIAANGSVSGQLSDINGNPTQISRQGGSIGTGGVVTFNDAAPGERCVMSAGKTVMVGTSTWGSGAHPTTAQISLDVKMAPSYAQSDLQGTWWLQTVTSGTGPSWQHAKVQIAADGLSTVQTADRNSSDTFPVAWSLAPDGIVTLEVAPGFRGVLDAGKTILVATDIESNGCSYMYVGVKMATDDVPAPRPPLAVSNPWPADGSTRIMTAPTVSWMTGGVDGSAVTHDVYLGTTNPPVTRVATATAATSLLVPNLVPGTTYYWRVVASDGAGRSVNGPVWSFTTSAATIDPGLVAVPGGTFETNGHVNVTITGFSIDRYEVTIGGWSAVRTWALSHGYSDLPSGQNYFGNSGPDYPVLAENWFDAVKWCNARSEMEGLTPVYCTDNTLATVYRTGYLDLNIDCVRWDANGYRLPTEAEFDFAARGGTASRGYIYAGCDNIDNVAWYAANSGNAAHAVGLKSANELGLYDMCGNASEWLWDWFGPVYPCGGTTDPRGPATAQQYRVLRDGGFWAAAISSSLGARGYDADGPSHHNMNGFRCVRR